MALTRINAPSPEEAIAGEATEKVVETMLDMKTQSRKKDGAGEEERT